MKMIKLTSLVLMLFVALYSCTNSNNKSESSESNEEVNETVNANPMENKGVGNVKEVTLNSEIDLEMSENGKKIFEAMCVACHKIDKKYIGPQLSGVTTRRAPEWIMNMILNPELMIKEDPIAMQLLKDFNGSPMANQNLKEEEARAVLEYFRSIDAKQSTTNN